MPTLASATRSSVVKKSRATSRCSRFLTIPSLHGQNPILLPSVVLPSKVPVWLFDRPQSDRAKLPESTVHNRIVSTPSAPNLHLAWARVNGLKTSSSFHGAPEKPSEMN